MLQRPPQIFVNQKDPPENQLKDPTLGNSETLLFQHFCANSVHFGSCKDLQGAESPAVMMTTKTTLVFLAGNFCCPENCFKKKRRGISPSKWGKLESDAEGVSFRIKEQQKTCSSELAVRSGLKISQDLLKKKNIHTRTMLYKWPFPSTINRNRSIPNGLLFARSQNGWHQQGTKPWCVGRLPANHQTNLLTSSGPELSMENKEEWPRTPRKSHNRTPTFPKCFIFDRSQASQIRFKDWLSRI